MQVIHMFVAATSTPGVDKASACLAAVNVHCLPACCHVLRRTRPCAAVAVAVAVALAVAVAGTVHPPGLPWLCS